MTEPTDWIGGQLTSQCVPPDEHPWIERFGCTGRYRRFRDDVREFYRNQLGLGVGQREFNPGEGWVSRLCHEPRIAWLVLNQMLQPYVSRGLLEIVLNAEPVGAGVSDGRVTEVALTTPAGELRVEAKFVLDASETGDLLPLTGTEYRLGAESKAQTGEPHALEGEPRPDVVQGFTWVFAMGWDPSGDHRAKAPSNYDIWRLYQPDFWPDRLLSWKGLNAVSMRPVDYGLFPDEGVTCPLFTYRRVVAPPREQVTLVNWPQNDYYLQGIVDVDPDERASALQQSRELSLCLLHWLQTEAPRPDGGRGWPGLRLRPDITGTLDGLAKAPYIRESRRILARTTILESYVSAALNPGQVRAQPIEDSVGVGAYRLDLHPSTGGENTIDLSSLPFQIPLGALIPVRTRNLLPACKNLGTTHITNGCTRLHPVEWNIGEAAGALAAFCLARQVEPADLLESTETLCAFQADLVADGFELDWPALRPL